jgi:hypothetical protein
VAGIKGEHVVLFLEDFQFTSDSMLEMVNSLLSSGEVPGMYSHEELEPLLMPLKEKMRDEGSVCTPYVFFADAVLPCEDMLLVPPLFCNATDPIQSRREGMITT